jgi:flagellar basal-body rod protein FlgB
MLRAERQRLLASNIANADTPGYQARDMDFRHRAAPGHRPGPGRRPAAAPAPAHLSPPAGAAAAPDCAMPPVSQTNLDRNTVDMDRERASFADNAVKYEATLRFINGSVRNDARRHEGSRSTRPQAGAIP